MNWLDQDNLNYLSNAEEEYIDVQRRGWLVNQPVRLNQSVTKRKGSKTELYSELIYQLTFTRQTWSEIMQTFIPSIMLSLASASSLYIDYSQLPARMGLAATSFLSLIALFKGSSEKWPQTAYLKAIDVWTLLSYFGAFFCLVEYAFVLHVSNKLHKITSVVSLPKYYLIFGAKIQMHFFRTRKLKIWNGEKIGLKGLKKYPESLFLFILYPFRSCSL